MKQHRILAAEDSPTQAIALRAHLEDAGFHVSLAANGVEALALMDTEAFDLVVSDVVMPDVDGYDLCRAVKERHPRVPVVLLTSLADPLDVVNALSAGADNFLRKPYQPEDLVNRVRNMLHNKELRDSGRAQMGLELFFLGRRFMINSEREQILDLLVSTFEDLVDVNQRLRAREDELARAHKQLAERLEETEFERDRLNTVVTAFPGPMAVFDRDGRILNANEALAQLLGVPGSTMRGALAWETIRFLDHFGEPLPQEQRALCVAMAEASSVTRGTAFDLFLDVAGTSVPVVARAEPIRDRSGEIVGAVGTLEDLRMLMRHDPVTGLPGHDAVVDWLRAEADASNDPSYTTGVAVLVLDRFERIRQMLPATGCDSFLSRAVDHLRHTLGSTQVRHRCAAPAAAYLGNGEMAIVLPEIEDEADAVAIGEILLEHLSGPIGIDGIDVELTVSVAVGTSDGADPAGVVASLAAAARRASARGGRQVEASDGTLHADVIDFLRRESELRKALAGGQLVVHYQPEVRIHDGRPVAVEALVRWQHPERGLLGAGEVIPLAVESGLISAVSWHVLEQAAAEVARWRRELPLAEALILSVNLAAEQLSEPDIAARVEQVLAGAGLDPTALVLEITEGSVMEERHVAAERLTAVKSLGVHIAVDDFGTGYSSLAQLRHLPVDLLKIDRTFVAGMLHEPADAAIVSGSLRLARALGLEVVAEGVETADQLVQLRILGCDLGQGYHWAKPQSGADFEVWWRAQGALPAADERGPGLLGDTDERHDEAIAYLVHELRTPLSVITGYASMLAETELEPDVADYTAAILRNADELDRRMTALGEANDVLRGRLSIETEECDVSELVRTLADDLATELAPHPLVLTAPEAIDALVDPARLNQAVTNLMTNAAKFAPGDTPVEVAVVADEATVVISVRDHGPGIPEERRHELFRRFSRLGTRSKGMGIGLYLARLIVEAHGGALRFEQAPGGGALFSIHLPRLTGPDGPGSVSGDAAPPG